MDETESYKGYTVVGGQIALGNSAVVVSEEYETLIDTKKSGTGYLDSDDEDWDRLLSTIEDGTLAVAAPGSMGEESSLDVNATKSSLTLDASEGSGARIAVYIHFPSESDAETAMETARDQLAEEATGSSDIEIETLERDADRIIIEGATSDFDF